MRKGNDEDIEVWGDVIFFCGALTHAGHPNEQSLVS